MAYLFSFAVLPCLQVASAQDFSGVPGVVINHLNPPTPLEKLLNINEHYVTDPSIVVMPNGDYIASHSEFDSGTTATTHGKTWVFRSTDDGATWTELEILDGPETTYQGMHRGSLFVLNNELYMIGYKAAPGDILIRKSTDYGDTWTTPTDTNNGVLFTGNYGGTPNNPVVYGGKIWSAMGTRLISADINDDLFKASSWTISNSISQNPGGDWLDGQFTFWSEGQVVASPQTGVVLMPKIGELPFSAMIEANETTGSLSFDAANGFVSLPGAEKKFGATYDPVSAKFYALTSIVLPAHADSGVTAALTRNTAAMLSSSDLRHWDVNKIFLYSENLDAGGFGEGFQYFNFDFDADDMVIVSRTAYDTTGNGLSNYPPRGHDTNLLTFHRIDDFRTATPDQQLVIDAPNNTVLRRELNGNDDIAPLGGFALGALFAGSPLTNPIDLAQDPSGNVYIKEQAGRILQFDAAGNFLAVVPSAPVAFQGSQISVDQPAMGERSWIPADSTDWFEPTNWYYWGRPDTASEVANFGSAAEAASTVSLDESLVIKGLRFRNDAKYTLNGSGDLTLEADVGNSVIDVQLGDHEVQLAVELNSHTVANAELGTNLRFRQPFDMNGQTLELQGQGRLRVYDEFIMNGGTILVDGQAVFTFGGTVSATLNGNLQLVLDPGVAPTYGQEFDLLNGVGYVSDTFNNVLLPQLPGGLSWDTSRLYIDGVVSVISDLAGDFDGDSDVDGLDFLFWQQGSIPDPYGVADLYDWESNFGTPAPTFAEPVTIPEPSPGLLWLAGTLGILFRDRAKWL